jgi:tRNA pseudouridine55 synthase
MNDGILLIDKAPGLTSHDVVQRVRRILKLRKVGHCGTLDPSATGLLVITLGKATRLTRFLIRAPKVYCGEIRFGLTTDTYDASGTITDETDFSHLTEERVLAAMQDFVGTFKQAAPPFSAKKTNGVRYYTLARRGEEVPEALKEISVFEFSPLSELVDGTLKFRLACSSGTYVRSVAHDLGQQLECGAHLAALRRLSVGPLDVVDALTLPALEEHRAAGNSTSRPAWIPLEDIPLPFGQLVTDTKQERRITNGQTVLIRGTESSEGDWIRLLTARGKLLAIGTVVERIGAGGVGVIQPRIVFK